MWTHHDEEGGRRVKNHARPVPRKSSLRGHVFDTPTPCVVIHTWPCGGHSTSWNVKCNDIVLLIVLPSREEIRKLQFNRLFGDLSERHLVRLRRSALIDVRN